MEDGRIYGSWWQNGAGTGRMASSSPNLQNLPPEVRRYVKAPAGRVLVVADYSQIELRIAAKISATRGCSRPSPTARTFTRSPPAASPDAEVTKQERKLAKAVNFGLLYGMSPGGLRSYARSYGVEMTREEAERYWQSSSRPILASGPGMIEYLQLKKHGSTETRTLTGRRRTGRHEAHREAQLTRTGHGRRRQSSPLLSSTSGGASVPSGPHPRRPR